jgi:hypothetical protein
MCEADPDCFARVRVFVDTREGALEEAGDLLGAIACGAISADEIAGDLAELGAGQVQARFDPETITLFKSVGASIEDLAAVELVYRSLVDAEAQAGWRYVPSSGWARRAARALSLSTPRAISALRPECVRTDPETMIA